MYITSDGALYGLNSLRPLKHWDRGLEVFTAGTMKNAVFWDVTPCGSYKNRYFEGT
jgi:hypothetical protein